MTENSRIHLLTRDAAAEDIKPLYDRADSAMTEGQIPGPTLFGNQVRALAHNPALLQSIFGVYESFAATASVDRRLMELGVLVVSRVNACTYCLQHHTPLAHESGLTQAQLHVINEGTWNNHQDLFAPDEWLVIQLAEQMTHEPYKMTDKFFDDLHTQFDDRQIVDMTMRFALCSAWNKFNDALGLNTESAFQHAFSELMTTS